nr:MAG TPA: hypothetical protein [Caudoviricetes sp.]
MLKLEYYRITQLKTGININKQSKTGGETK